MDNKPLLSISIPTYNRANRLVRMLECLVPQAMEFAGELEIVITDNASDDNTRQVIDEFSRKFPIRYVHNGINIGGILNLIFSGAARPQGEYVWIMGDDDLLSPGAITNVMTKIRENQNYDIFTVNLRGASYHDHWPVSCLGGYDGPFLYLLNENTEDVKHTRYEDFLTPLNGFGTQLYVAIVRQKFWRDYYHGKAFDRVLIDEHSIFPHSVFIARTFYNKPCYFIGKPSVTSFEGGACWEELAPWIILQKVPELLDTYLKIGLSPERVKNIRKQVYYSWCTSAMLKQFNKGKRISTSWLFMKNKLLSPLAWGAWFYTILRALPEKYFNMLRVVYRSITLRKSESAK